MTASDISTNTVITGMPETAIEKAADLMSQHQISAIPVLDIRIVNRANLLQSLAVPPSVHIRSGADEDEKRDVVLGALAQVPWPNPVHVNVIVTGNRVDVWGIANSNDKESAAKVTLEAIDGLGEVSMHLDCSPNSASDI